MSQETPVRIGLIGFGAWGKFHAEGIALGEGTELVAIAARSEETRAEAAAAQARCSDAELELAQVTREALNA